MLRSNCSSTTDSPAVSGGEGVGGGRGVGAPESGNTESGGLVACREQGDERHENGLHPGHIPFTYIRYTVPSAGAMNRSGNIAISFFVLERLRCQ